MIKKTLLFITTLSLLITLGVITVSAQDDKFPEENRDAYAYAVKGGTVKSINDLINAFTDVREGNDTVYIKAVSGKANTFYLDENVVLKSSVVITEGSYTILGADRTVYRGTDYDSLFVVDGTNAKNGRPSLILKDDMTLDGMSDKYLANSGLVLVFGAADFYADDVQFLYSDAHGSMGGAIYTKTHELSDYEALPLPPNAEVNNCTFSYCRSNGGGAIAATAVGKSLKGDFKISNCVFTNNSTFEDEAYTNGGAIYISASDFQITDCTFTSNSADHGGVIYASVKTKLQNCSMEYNTARKDGGVIYSTGDVTADNCIMMYNNAQNGGVIAGRGTLTTDNSYISENVAAENGGAIYFDGEYNFKNGNITLNEAYKTGGGIYLSGATSKLNMTDGEIVANKAKYCASVYCKGNFDFMGGAIGNGVSGFPHIFVYGKATMGAKTSVKDDIFALAVRVKDGEKTYSRIKLDGVPESKRTLNVAYAQEQFNEAEDIIGFSNATRNSVPFFEGSADAIKKIQEIAVIKSRGVLSYKLNDKAEASVRFIFLPIWVWMVIAAAAVALTIFLLRNKLKPLFVKKDKIK